MSNWDDMTTDELYALHNLLGVAAGAKEKKDETLSKTLDKLYILRKVISKLSDEFYEKCIGTIVEILHKKSVVSQENT